MILGMPHLVIPHLVVLGMPHLVILGILNLGDPRDALLGDAWDAQPGMEIQQPEQGKNQRKAALCCGKTITTKQCRACVLAVTGQSSVSEPLHKS